MFYYITFLLSLLSFVTYDFNENNLQKTGFDLVKNDTIRVKNTGNENLAKELNNAIQASSAEHLVLIFQKGTYSVNAAIKLKEDMEVIGNGAVIRGSVENRDPVMLIQGVSNITINDLSLNGQYLDRMEKTWYFDQGILIQAKDNAVKNIKINRVSVSNTKGAGIMLVCWPNREIASVEMDSITINNVNYGIFAYTKGGNGIMSYNVSEQERRISNLQITNSEITTSHGNGIEIIKAENVLIKGNYVHNCKNGHGINLWYCNDFKVLDNKSNNNNIHGTNKKGWGVVISAECYDFEIKNNVCKYNNVGGITIDVTPNTKPRHRIDTKNSLVAYNVCSYNQLHGIAARYAESLKIIHNQCIGNKKNGIGVYNSSDIIVSYNTCLNNTRGIAVNYSFKEKTSNVTLKENKLGFNEKEAVFWDNVEKAPNMINNRFTTQKK